MVPSGVLLRLVDELGEAIEDAWQRINFERAAFPALCGEHLARAGLHTKLDLDQLVSAAFSGRLPGQPDPAARFGQPPLTLFRCGRFWIDALFWVDGTTAIHDHAFSGAFQVLAGKSIETTFTFEEADAGDGHVKVGTLRCLAAGLRRTGDVQAIPAGPDYIHSLFHLDRPSISLVVRTSHDPVIASQYEYSPAGLAFDPFQEDDARARRVQLARMLRTIDHPRLAELVGDTIAGSDFNTAFAIVRGCVRFPDVVLDTLLSRIGAPELQQRVRRWVEHRKRIEFIQSKREVVHDPALRFFLAVLLNAQNRAHALHLVQAFAPAVPPARQVATWLRELSAVTAKLTVAGLPFQPNLLGLPKFEPAFERCVADALAGEATTLSGEEAALVDRLRAMPYLAVLFR